MSYGITQQTQNAILAGAREPIYIRIDTNPVLNLTSADIKENTFAINRYCSSGKRIELGTTIASEIDFTIIDNGDYDSVALEGYWLYAYTIINSETIPLGHFLIDQAVRRNGSIEIVGLDRMSLFDTKVDPSTLSTEGSTVLTWITWLGQTVLGSASNINYRDCVNLDYQIRNVGNLSSYTYRDILSFLCEITGTVGMFTYAQVLQMLKPYHSGDTAILDISKSIRFSSEISELPLTITGVSVTVDDVVYTAGTDDYMLTISNNPLITHDVPTLVSNIYDSVDGLTYYPFSAEVISLPHIYPLDLVSLELYDGTYADTIITDITYKLNRNTELGARGESQTMAENAPLDSFTRSERSTITQVNEKTVNLMTFSDLLQGALGLFLQTENTVSGVKYYFSNKEALEDSTYIIGLTANGIGFATEWNGDATEWTYGIADTGEAFFSWLSANGITVSTPGSAYSITITPSQFNLKWNGTPVSTLNIDTMEIPKIDISERADFGVIRLVTRDDGLAFVYVG